VRTGLVVIGAALAVIGGGLFVTLFVGYGGPTSTTQSSFENPGIPPHQPWPALITSPTSSASISLVWSTNIPANVSLTPAVPCHSSLGVCPVGPPLFAWNLTVSGKESGAPGPATTFILEVVNPGGGTLAFMGTVSLGYSSGSPLPTWAWALIALAGVALLAMGGIALFLGLFLPGGVYRNPPGSTDHLRPPLEPLDEDEPPP